jgi:hypothetical protein
VVQKPIFGDEHGKLLKAVGTRGIGIWVVPAVTGCSHGPRAREIAGWTGDHWSDAKPHLDSTGANLPRGAGFSWQYPTTRPATVTYTWVDSHGRTWPEHRRRLSLSGVSAVSHKWKLGKPGRTVDEWVQLKVISPEQRLSNKVPVSFSCVK